MRLRNFEITAAVGPRSEVRVDGTLLGGVRGFTLTDDVHDVPLLALDVPLIEATKVSGEAVVIVPPSTRETLIALGWTPPAEGGDQP